MKTLLFLNGPEGWQSGIEDGFVHLRDIGEISELSWFYFEAFAKNNNTKDSILKMLELVNEFQPKLIIFFHVGKFPISIDFITNIKQCGSKPKLVYDEGDMYGGWAKPITKSMKILFSNSDIVSIRGLGKWYKTIKKYNNNVVYTPHSNSLYRISKDKELKTEKKYRFIFIGNKVTSYFGKIRRLNGSKEREKIVRVIADNFPNQIKIFGKGWNGIKGYQGLLDFNKQVDVCLNSWVQISYEHYPKIPLYFSDRLPIALSSGQIYVCHYHDGYENMFINTDFIYFYKDKNELLDILVYLNSLSEEQLYNKSIRAKEWCEINLSPLTVWSNLYNAIKKRYDSI